MSATPAAQLGPYDVPDSDFRILLHSVPADKPRVLGLNTLESLVLEVVSAKTAGPECPQVQATFDAVMPAHGHGMVTRAVVRALGSGRFQVDGVKLHMKGEWELPVQVHCGSETYQVSIPYFLD